MLFESADNLQVQQEADDRAWADSQVKQSVEAKERPERIALEKQARANLAANRMVEVTPGTNEYEYSTAVMNGYDGTPDDNGDVYLPNEALKPKARVMGGVDMATGDKLTYSPEEPRFRAQLNGDRTEKKEHQFRQMNALEKFGELLVGEGDAPAVVAGVMRGVVNGFYKYSNDVNKLASFVSSGYYNVPKIQELPDMGAAENLLSEITRFGGLYATAGAGLGSVLSSRAVVTQEAVKDSVATFAMDPSDGNLISVLREEFGITGIDEVDAKKILASDGEGLARLTSVLTDSGLLTGATTGAVFLAQNVMPVVRSLQKRMADSDIMLEVAYTRMADDLIEDGRAKMREGLTTFNSGMPKQVEGAAQELAGQTINVASGVAKRLSSTREGLLQAAKGHVMKGISEDEFISEYSKSGVNRDVLARVYDEASGSFKSLEMDESVSVERFSEMTEAKYGLQSFDLYEKNNVITLNSLIAPKEARKQGKGTSAMNDLIKYADKKGKRVYLNPALKDDFHGTTSRNRLVKFYKRFGFVENKGRNKDFSFMGGMYRDPRNMDVGK